MGINGLFDIKYTISRTTLQPSSSYFPLQCWTQTENLPVCLGFKQQLQGQYPASSLNLNKGRLKKLNNYMYINKF